MEKELEYKIRGLRPISYVPHFSLLMISNRAATSLPLSSA